MYVDSFYGTISSRIHYIEKPFCGCREVLLFQFAFPDTDNLPSTVLETLRCFYIPLDVPLTLFLPILGMVGWSRISAIMAMPKTAVDKDGDSLVKENEIGMTFYLICSPPAGDMVFLEQLNHCQLGAFCIAAFYGAHY